MNIQQRLAMKRHAEQIGFSERGAFVERSFSALSAEMVGRIVISHDMHYKWKTTTD